MGWFIVMLKDDPQYYFMVVLSVIISVVLHELAHGWIAVRLGDDTPIHSGHMTGNPLVHMGPISLAFVFLTGLGWGAMPVDHTRLRGRYAGAQVALAGPAMNLFLAAIALAALSMWEFHHPVAGSPASESGRTFLHVFGLWNVMLGMFNLAPVPPLDGSWILSDFCRPYREFLREHEDKTWLMFAGYWVLVANLGGTRFDLWRNAALLAEWYMGLWR